MVQGINIGKRSNSVAAAAPHAHQEDKEDVDEL
jgi:hypothetical protein